MLSCQTPPTPTHTVRFAVDMLQHLKPDTGLRDWCAWRDPVEGRTCVDGLIGTATWPDFAVICLDEFRPDRCVRLGDLRAWVANYQLRSYVRHDTG